MNNYNMQNVRIKCINHDPQVDCHILLLLKYFNQGIQMRITILRLNDDSNERYLQARFGNILYNLQIYNKAQLIDTTINSSR